MGITRLAGPSSACTTPASATGPLHCSLRWLCSSPRTGPRQLLGVVSWRFAPDTAVNLAINIVIVSFFAFFEEIGWRGYMLPKLETRYPRLAPALVGFLHGVWHLPLMLLTTAYNPIGNRFIVVPLFLAVLTAAGVLYGYLRDASGSLWPVVIAHGTFNAVLGVLAGAAVAENPTLAAYLTGETGNIYPARNRDRCLGAGQAPCNRSRTPPCCAGVI
jgi:membrane protease YdiL (CAAX protease family)